MIEPDEMLVKIGIVEAKDEIHKLVCGNRIRSWDLRTN